MGWLAAATRKQRQTGVRRRKGDLGEYSGEPLEKQEERWSKWHGSGFCDFTLWAENIPGRLFI